MFPLFGRSGDPPADGNRRKKLIFLLVLLAAVGVLLLLFGGRLGEGDTDGTEEASEDLQAYQAELEEKIRSLCEAVRGVSDVTVAVTVESGSGAVYATETTTKGAEYVIVGSGSSAKALYLSKSPPKIAGIGIVCRGGGDSNIRLEIISLISAAFHIGSNRVHVSEKG